MRYFLATLSLSSFAFAFLFYFASGAQHIAGAGSHAVGNSCSPDHPRNLLDASSGVKTFNRGEGTPPADLFFDTELRGPTRGDLRQVRDAEHLEAFAKLPQADANHIGHTAADSRVDLIE